MSTMFAIKIDVTKILNDRLFKADSGAIYLDAVMIPSPESRYGDSHFIAQSVTKEERQQGKKGPIIGNAKQLGGGKGQAATPAPAPAGKAGAPAARYEKGNVDEDVPF